jgi:twitching motility protein PilT
MDRATIDPLLTAMLETSEGVSDLLFLSGRPPLVEIHGLLHEFAIDTPTGLLDQAFIQNLAGHLMNGQTRLTDEFARIGSCDCSYAIAGVARFRINIFKQTGRHAIVMRRLPSAVPTLESLALPPVFREIVQEKNGIVLVTGATGSGKTTTLAAMMNELNASQEIHVVTLEDPIEFQHEPRKAAISQRELGNDFPTFADGLRAALRQAPKAILVGEIRDRQSMEIAMSASETGHIVFSTLHTINAGHSINRILGMFMREEEQQLRQRLADTIRYIVSQRLVPKIDGGRLLITEIMGSNLRTREAIVYGESENKSFHEIIEAGSTMGWHSFDQNLLAAFESELVVEETAMLYCTNKTHMRQLIDQAKKRRGAVHLEGPSGLKMSMPASVESILQEVQNKEAALKTDAARVPKSPPVPAQPN